MTTNTNVQSSRLIDRKEVERRTSLRKTSIWRLIRDGDFPKPIPLGGKSAWVEHEVESWIAARIASRDKAA